ncbi:MAG TPA: chromate transporter [Anaerolineales bacterium]|nr:chromate transporter [Anaerolineales bacterium]
MNQSKLELWLHLFWMFLKINLLSTSGPASIGLLYKESVDKKLMTEAQFVEAVGFSNVLPGSEALKLAMFVGFAAGGFSGTSAALLGSVLPPTVIMLAVAATIQRYQGEAWMQGFMNGLGPAVAMLIVVVAWQIFRADGAKPHQGRVLIIVALSAVGFWLDVPPPLVLFGAGMLGVVLSGRRSVG